MKILMTGATGFVGVQLKKRLEEKGHYIVSLGRKDFPPHPEQVNGAKGLIHLAGENIAAKRWTSARKIALRDSRVETATKIREALKGSSTQLEFVISASAVGIYGDRGAEILTEASKPGDGFLSGLCLEWESAVDSIPADRHVKLRMGVVLGAGGGFLAKVVPLFRKFGASRLGPGTQWFSWVAKEDVLNVYCRAVETRMNGVYNLTSPNPVTNAQLTRELAKTLGVWLGPPVPKLILRMLYGELSQALLSSQRAQPERLLKEGYVFVKPDLKSALVSGTSLLR